MPHAGGRAALMHDFPHPHEHEDHEGEPVGLPDETDPVWRQERIELRSVGIDIGSSTSHLTFSRLVLRRMGVHLSSRYRVVERHVLAQSPILLTPYRDAVTIDTERLGAFVADGYRFAGITPEGIDTGAVVITGEAAKKVNAEAILALFAREAGRFVCATAGPQLEAIMAAHGSGAIERSRGGGAVLNVDIGGGTTKLALCREGEVADTAVINVGGRLVAHEAGRIARLEDAGLQVGEAVGRRFALGATLDAADLTAMAEALVECLFEVVDRRPLSPLARALMHTAPLGDGGPVSSLVFSGGVAEYIYARETRDFGDLGQRLGDLVRRRLATHPLGARLAVPTEAIRATVIGAAQYTVQVSGSTVFHPTTGVLPLRNVPVFPVAIPTPLEAEGVAEAVRRALGVRRSNQDRGAPRVSRGAPSVGGVWGAMSGPPTSLNGRDDEGRDGPLALAIRWPFGPGYAELRALGEGLLAGLGPRSAATVLAFDRDIARLVGHLMVEELGAPRDLVAVDELELGTFDYVDVGEPLPVSGVIPVVIKSLVFRPAMP